MLSKVIFHIHLHSEIVKEIPVILIENKKTELGPKIDEKILKNKFPVMINFHQIHLTNTSCSIQQVSMESCTPKNPASIEKVIAIVQKAVMYPATPLFDFSASVSRH
jgi:hypothetical protein